MKQNLVSASRSPGFSRRHMLTGMGMAGGGLLLGNTFPKSVLAEDKDEHTSNLTNATELCTSPDPIPHINKFTLAAFGVKLHFYFPGPVEGTFAPLTDHEPGNTQTGGRDPAVIYDFKGFLGQADLILTGTGTDLNTGLSQKYTFHTDSRFFSGVFLGTDGLPHHGTFAMV